MRRVLVLLGMTCIFAAAAACGPGRGPVPATPTGGGPQPTATFPPGMSRVPTGGGPVGPEQGRQLFATKGCVGCHTVSSVPGAVGTIGPRLDTIGDTSQHPRIATGQDQPCPGCAPSDGLPNTPENLKRWLSNPPAVKPGTAMPNLGLSPSEIDSLVAFLQTLK